MISARIQLTEDANRVLNVVKAKYDLKDKSDAINKVITLIEDEFIDKEANDEYVKKVLNIEKQHLKKYGQKHMSLKELDTLCGLH